MKLLISFLLVMFSLFLLIVSIIAIIKPSLMQSWLKAPSDKPLTRGKSLAAALSSIVLFIFAVSIAPEPTKEDEAKKTGSSEKAPNGSKLIPASESVVVLKQKYNQIKELIDECDADSKAIADVRKSKHPSFDMYYKTARIAEDTCGQGTFGVIKGDKFEDQNVEKVYQDLKNAASDYMRDKSIYAGKMKDYANEGRITPEQKYSLERRAASSLGNAIRVVSATEEVKKIIGEIKK
jgi:hypothetical protein